MLIDTHAHLNSQRFDGEIEQLLGKAAESGVEKVVSIACDLEDSIANLELARKYREILPTVGIHPLYVHEPGPPNWLAELENLAKEEEVVAIGEIGLDYHHPPQDGTEESAWRKKQQVVFESLLDLAIRAGLPTVIHQRDCAGPVAETLARFPETRAVLHCFNGSQDDAERALAMGHLISFTGILTFPKATDVREVARLIPLDRVMVETDCPFLAPVPYRGKRCEPAMVVETAKVLAELHGLSLDEIHRITTENAMRFFQRRS
ncbi:MAG: TatD family hydrolase [Verrucomicrobiota bacterium]